MALVLCTGSDRTLMQTRVMVLERAGHTVMSAMGEHELVAVCRRYSFDVAVIGQGIPRPEKQRVLRLLREHCPKSKVLELFIPSQGKMLPEADDWLEAPVSPPGDLAERVTALSAKSAGA